VCNGRNQACRTIEEAVAITLPSGEGQRNKCLWELARQLKRLNPNAGAAELKGILRDWHRLALPIIRTKPFDETWVDFTRAWERATHPAGCGRWADAVAIADSGRVLSRAAEYDTEPFQRLVRLCAALDQVHGGGRFFLGCRRAAEYLGVAHRTAAGILKTLRFDRVLSLEDDRKQSGLRAFEYRYLGVNQKGKIEPSH
jgi:hypothetical protein